MRHPLGELSDVDWGDFAALKGEAPGSADVCVALLDGPVDLHHPVFADCAIDTIMDAPGSVLSPAKIRAEGALAHGTAIASIIFGKASGCRGLVLPVLTDESDGQRIVCSQLDLAHGIVRAIEAGAHVINVSAGEFSPDGSAHPLLTDAVHRAAAEGALIVAAVGNDGCECLHVPGALPSVLAVGAMDGTGRPIPLSNWGEAYRANGILAPGVDVPVAVPGGGVGRRSGTSYACAMVSAAAALLLSAQKRRHGRMDALKIGAALIRTASPCAEGQELCLAGRINVGEALREVTGMPSDSAQDDRIEPRVAAADGTAAELSTPSPTAEVTASDCGCGCAPGECTCKAGPKEAAAPVGTRQFVYALGMIGYDFGTEFPARLYIRTNGGDRHAALTRAVSRPPGQQPLGRSGGSVDRQPRCHSRLSGTAGRRICDHGVR